MLVVLVKRLDSAKFKSKLKDTKIFLWINAQWFFLARHVFKNAVQSSRNIAGPQIMIILHWLLIDIPNAKACNQYR